jgi:hypothetical protein
MTPAGPPPRPRSPAPDQLRFRRRRSVRWLDPRQLLTTGWQAVVSGIFGSFADKREVEAVLGKASLDDRTAAGELWIDFAADLGDGFKATYTMARLLAAPALDLTDPRGGHRETRRGGILVLGGDQVYPTAKETAYEDRFAGPYRAALPWSGKPNPTLLAIPGNHDWYDGLTSFLRVFCQRKWIGGWRTEQTRSYFAVRLAHGWWLWGIDIQLNSYIDTPQLAFFTGTVARKVAPGDSIILCTATPAWVKAAAGPTGPRQPEPAAVRNLRYFERTVVEPTGARVALYLSGDLHHYARYEQEPPEGGGAPRQRITAGGGGAFLHGTHHLPAELAVEEGGHPARCTRRAVYPSAGVSRRLAWTRIWALGPLNHGFAVFTGVIYAGLAWLIASGRTAPGGGLGAVAAGIGWDQLVPGFTRSPVAVLTLLLLGRGLIGFAAVGRPGPGRWARGILHTLLHLAAVGAVAVASSGLVGAWGLAGWRATGAYLAGALVLGAVAGPLAMALYLWACGLFGVHLNESFGAMRVIDHKCFLRMHLAGDGSLTVYPVGVDRVARRFRVAPEAPADAPWLEPTEPVLPRLIEDPVVLPPPHRAPPGPVGPGRGATPLQEALR